MALAMRRGRSSASMSSWLTSHKLVEIDAGVGGQGGGIGVATASEPEVALGEFAGSASQRWWPIRSFLGHPVFKF